jgi:hypothetical protein
MIRICMRASQFRNDVSAREQLHRRRTGEPIAAARRGMRERVQRAPVAIAG